MEEIKNILIVSTENYVCNHIASKINTVKKGVRFIYSSDSAQAISDFTQFHPEITYIDENKPAISPMKIVRELIEHRAINTDKQSIVIISSLNQESIDSLKPIFKAPFINFFIKEIVDKSLQKGEYIDELNYEVVSSIHFHENRMEKQQENILNRFGIDHNIFHTTQILKQKLIKNDIEIIIIGISTGGPSLFKRVISQITYLPVPLVVVQHIGQEFLIDYCKGLQIFSTFPIKIVKNNEILKNEIYFAPVQFHLKIRKRNGVLSAEYDYTASPNGHIPSIEKIFESAIDFKLKVLGIIMTGIGDDGTHALATLHSIYKRPTIAQSPIDSYAFGMPSALIQKGAADAVLQVNEIAEVINSVNTF